MVQKIDYKDAKGIFVDTRSPGEFAEDNIPGSINIPIFDDDERALVGTIYTRVDKDLAIEKGKGIFEQKIDNIKKQLLTFKGKKVIIYCWRGGMRSKAITELAESSGLDANQLNGGYKQYRKYVRESLQDLKVNPRLVVLHGLTGSGKTDLLQMFDDMIDLEGMAQHRSSVYGSIGLEPRSQKMFESRLLATVQELQDRRFVIVEGESRKVGSRIIPEKFWKAMKSGINIEVTCSFESRVQRLMRIYTYSMKDRQKTKEITLALANKIGKKNAQELSELVDNDLHEFMKRILELYYDPLYKYSISKIGYGFAVDTDDMAAAKKKIADAFELM